MQGWEGFLFVIRTTSLTSGIVLHKKRDTINTYGNKEYEDPVEENTPIQGYFTPLQLDHPSITL